MPHTKVTVLLVCFQWVDTLALKHAKGMSLRYDVICTLGIGDTTLCEAPYIVADINHCICCAKGGGERGVKKESCFPPCRKPRQTLFFANR